MPDAVKERALCLTTDEPKENRLRACLLQEGTLNEEGILGHKKKREALRELKNPDGDRTLEVVARFDDATQGLDHGTRAEFERSKEVQLLSTIPGIGEITSVTQVAYLTPIERFDSVN